MSLHHRLALFPETVQCVRQGATDELYVGGCNLAHLADRYGTPLYLFDAVTLDAAVHEYRTALTTHYPGASGITYAGKAGLTLALARWARRRDLWIDCTGLGEMHVAAAAGVPRDQLLVHGVNKSDDDLALAMQVAGTIVVDNLDELERILGSMPADSPMRPQLWLRIRPGTAVDTHAYRQTGQETSKFGMGLDEAVAAVQRTLLAGAPLTGIHFHQGSHFHDPTPIGPALASVLALIQEIQTQTGWSPSHLCPGGGWGIAYHDDDLPQPSIERYVAYVARIVAQGFTDAGLPLPALHVEPGRSLVGRAGVALYRIGAVKTAGNRRWLLVDGGMADNIRPALYGARYSALPVSDPMRPAAGPCWIGGPYCESGDVLIEELAMGQMAPGELIAVPASGAYHISMSSNYNGACRPAVLWLRDGVAHVIRRREEPADLLLLDQTIDDAYL